MFEFKSTIHGLFLLTHFYLINNPGYLNINFYWGYCTNMKTKICKLFHQNFDNII